MSTSDARAASAPLPARPFYPLSTIKSVGTAHFRSQAARDAACLLDLDPDVDSWSCQTEFINVGDRHHVFDLVVEAANGRVRHVDVDDRTDVGAAVEAAAARAGLTYVVMSVADFSMGYRLQNAKDLLRYGNYRVPLGDRVTLLRALDEQGSLPIAECLGAFRETRPMAGLAALILAGFVEVNLDEAPLGPETLVRRIRD